MRKTISLSEYLKVSRSQLEDVGVFDTTLGIDTKLFVDPKLLIKSGVPEFKNSRITILKYFAQLLKIHKQSYRVPRLLDKAKEMLAVPEPRGLSIGYGNKSDRGTAISRTLADKILLSASEILAVGIDDEELIEVLGLFVDGFGPDSMSDLTVSIVYSDFAAYTERIATELRLKTKTYLINGKKYNLPKHPFNDFQVIFVPLSLLRPLPIAVSWDEIAAAAEHNRRLRQDFNQILLPVLKEFINEIKTRSKQEIKSFRDGFNKLLSLYRRVPVSSYNIKSDIKGYYSIQPFVEKESAKIKASSVPKTYSQLIFSVRELIGQYRRTLEDNGGNTLLYRKSDTGKLLKHKPHNEDVSQIIFYLVADLYCQTANILLSREPNAGLGPVDFSLGTGYSDKVLVEIKKSTNKDLENGYKKQIVAYEKSEAAKYSFFVVIVVKEGKKNPKDLPLQLISIKRLFEEKTKNKERAPELIIIDGLVHASPSKLK